ncbi:MAG: hypothetical protein AAF184_12830 [Pseudomonadota bacterium]
MFDMFLNSVTLFLRGKLFKDLDKVIRQVVIGALVVAALCVALKLAGLSLPIAAAASGFTGGLLQPWLFRNLKYA